MKDMHVSLVIWMVTILMVSGNAQETSDDEIPDRDTPMAVFEKSERHDLSIHSTFGDESESVEERNTIQTLVNYVLKTYEQDFIHAFDIAEARQREQEDLNKKYYDDGIDVYADTSSSTGLAFINNRVQNYSELAKIDKEETIAFFFTEALKAKLEWTSDFLENKIFSKAAGKYLAERIGIECNPTLYVPSENLISCEDQRYSPYRTSNGSCNNLLKGRRNYGASFDIQLRRTQAGYEDGFNAPRLTGKNGLPLRNARNISVEVLSQGPSVADHKRSQMFVSWGQLIDHEVTEGPFSRGINETAISCCSLPLKERLKRVQCASAIDLTGNADEPVFSPDRTCMNMVRTVGVRQNRCKLGIRHQINAVTSYLDASAVYGSEEDVAKRLRLFKEGKLKTSIVRGKTLLPFEEDPEQCVLDGIDEGLSCFLAGDARVNEQPGLSSVHTFLVLFHNKLASKLSTMIPLDDEEIYQIIRKLVGGFQQIVTYNEWLPLLIGRNVMRKFRLTLDTEFDYDPYIDPAILMPFTTAAFRMGHSLVSESVESVDKYGNSIKSSPLEDQFFNPELLIDNAKSVVLGGLSSLAQKADGNFIPALQNNLFTRLEDSLDLMALNIQRGRDHGLPGYVKFAELHASNFSQLIHHDEDTRRLLEGVYQNVDDVDPFVGAITEKHTVSGSILGPTFTKLIAKQFKYLKFGDRYWIQNDLPLGFTSEQIDNLKKVRLAGALCQTFGFHEVNANVFDTFSGKRNCTSFPTVNLTLFLP